MTASIVGIAFSTAIRKAEYVPIGHRALGEGVPHRVPVAERIAVPGRLRRDRR